MTFISYFILFIIIFLRREITFISLEVSGICWSGHSGIMATITFTLHLHFNLQLTQKAELIVEKFAARSGLNVRTLFKETNLWPIKHISEYISMFSEGHK